jgi:NAD(P)-dependent dehydrogenase (short-subunit alcohol dehydrogenase family)
MDKIKGRTIAITGAARGIGYATAKALLARGGSFIAALGPGKDEEKS